MKNNNAFSDTRVVFFMGAILLVLVVVWILNYWTEYDGRHINNHQPIGINEMIYGGLARVRIIHPKMVLASGGPMKSVRTCSMVNQRYFYYFKGINNNQLSVEYVHSDSGGNFRKEDMKLPLSQGKTYLVIPALLEIVNSQEKMLTLTVIDGKGVYVSLAGDRYGGESKDGNRDGKGIMTYHGGTKYEGEFKDNDFSGKGILTHSNSTKYEGIFANGRIIGKAVGTRNDGTKYEGEFKNGRFNGKGILTRSDGSQYEGEFKNNKFDGKGVLIYGTGNMKYEGEFMEGKKNGKGLMSFSNGIRVKGEFKNGSVAGDVLVSYPNGDVFEGDCKHGLDHCKGLLTSKDGKKIDHEIESWRTVMAETTEASFSSKS